MNKTLTAAAVVLATAAAGFFLVSRVKSPTLYKDSRGNLYTDPGVAETFAAQDALFK